MNLNETNLRAGNQQQNLKAAHLSTKLKYIPSHERKNWCPSQYMAYTNQFNEYTTKKKNIEQIILIIGRIRGKVKLRPRKIVYF